VQNYLFVLSLFPLIILVGLLVSRKLSILVSTAITAIVTLFLSFIIWRMDTQFIVASSAKSVSIAFDIFTIIFGATFFWQFLENGGIVRSMRFYLRSVSSDIRVQTILLVWFFGGLIEGVAGFGTPAAIIAPMLVGIGLSPILAVAVPLVANSTAVIFGAVGTPVRVGFSSFPIEGVAATAAAINTVGFIVPIFILFVLSSIAQNRRLFITDALPFALFSGIAFVVPYIIAAQFGYEFPSIIGAVVGMSLAVICIKKKLFVPKYEHHIHGAQEATKEHSIRKVMFPYILLVFLLIGAKFFPISYTALFAEGISHTFNLLNPGFIFIISTLGMVLVYKHRVPTIIKTVSIVITKAIRPFFVILFISMTTQLMMHTNHNTSTYQSMMHTVSTIIHNSLLPFMAPFLGAFGSFIAGSATVSNLVLGTVVYDAAHSLGMNVTMLLALQLVGAGIGNMIAISNIVTAEAVVGLHGKEMSVLKKVILPCIIYLFLVGLIGLVQ